MRHTFMWGVPCIPCCSRSGRKGTWCRRSRSCLHQGGGWPRIRWRCSGHSLHSRNRIRKPRTSPPCTPIPEHWGGMSCIHCRMTRSLTYSYSGQRSRRRRGLSRSLCRPARTGRSRRSPGSRTPGCRPRSDSYRSGDPRRYCRRASRGRYTWNR